MKKDQIIGQKIYQDAIREFVSKSIDFDNAVKEYQDNKDTNREQQLEEVSKSAWALYCHQIEHMLYLADHVKDENGTAAAEAAKELRKIVFENLQGKYEFIIMITKPQNP